MHRYEIAMLTSDKHAAIAGSIVLVSCVKSKRTGRALARDLYTSPFFRQSRAIAERYGVRWYILSALYGLVEPTRLIASYDLTLNELDSSKRRAWAQSVFDTLMSVEPDLSRVTIFAGLRYREYLAPLLLTKGVVVNTPLAHLRQGEQRAWLVAHQ